MDLDAFAQTQPRRKRNCAVCILPPEIGQQVEAALAARRPTRGVIAAWLATKQQGHITLAMLNNHVTHGHHVG